MPEMNGFEVMEWLKSHPLHAAIPVIVASTFDRQREIRKSYQLDARTFLSKPVNPPSQRHPRVNAADRFSRLTDLHPGRRNSRHAPLVLRTRVRPLNGRSSELSADSFSGANADRWTIASS